MRHATNDPKDFLRSLEQRAKEPIFRSRRRFSVEQLREMIEAERLLAREQGLEWTNWRKFHCVEEAVSPNRCMRYEPNYRDPHCNMIATFVRYHTQNPVRIFLCSGHYQEEERRYRQSLAAARDAE